MTLSPLSEFPVFLTPHRPPLCPVSSCHPRILTIDTLSSLRVFIYLSSIKRPLSANNYVISFPLLHLILYLLAFLISFLSFCRLYFVLRAQCRWCFIFFYFCIKVMKMIGCKVSGCPIFVLCNRTGETHFTQNVFVHFFISLVRAKKLIPPASPPPFWIHLKTAYVSCT